MSLLFRGGQISRPVLLKTPAEPFAVQLMDGATNGTRFLSYVSRSGTSS